MSNLDKYIKNSKRDIFQWNCIETTDGVGMGGVLVEETCIDGRTATIRKESDNEYEVDIILKYSMIYNKENTYEIIEYRSNRKSARNFAEKFIKQDLMKDVKVSNEQLEEMKHSLGLNYKKVPYRNRFFTNKDDSNWNDLVNKRLAIKIDDVDSENCCYFYLTKFGAEYVYGKPISDDKYKEL